MNTYIGVHINIIYQNKTPRPHPKKFVNIKIRPYHSNQNPSRFVKVIFHFQDTMNEFYSGKSLADRGTLYHIKEFFNHKSLKSNVMENFQHVWDFIEVIILKWSKIYTKIRHLMIFNLMEVLHKMELHVCQNC